jgi:manganese/zinc/iron transport system permease protein
MSVASFLGMFSHTGLIIFGSATLGLVCGLTGTLMVLRKRALMGDALAHAALPGLCLGYLMFEQRSFFILFLGAVISGLLGVWCINIITEHTRLKDDAAIGITLSSFFGLGITLSRIIQNHSSGNRAGLDDFIFGKAATMVQDDIIVIIAVALITCALFTLLHKELKLLCFDRTFAESIGLPVKRLDLLIVTLIALSTMAALPAVGVVMASALLIFPAVIARVLTQSYTRMVLIAGVLGALSAALGTTLSAYLPNLPGLTGLGLPTGPTIVVCNAVALGGAYTGSCLIKRLQSFIGKVA